MAARKNNSRVVNPHDKLIRAVYGDRDNAHSFLTNNLPGKVLNLVDMSTLRFPKRQENIS